MFNRESAYHSDETEEDKGETFIQEQQVTKVTKHNNIIYIMYIKTIIIHIYIVIMLIIF